MFNPEEPSTREQLPTRELSLKELLLTPEEILGGSSDVLLHPKILTLPLGVRRDFSHAEAVVGETERLCREDLEQEMDRIGDPKDHTVKEIKRILEIAKRTGHIVAPSEYLLWGTKTLSRESSEICLSVRLGVDTSYSPEPNQYIHPGDYPFSKNKFRSYCIEVRETPEGEIFEGRVIAFRSHNISLRPSYLPWTKHWARLYQNRLLILAFGEQP